MREYFSHDYNARNDKKLVSLFMKHGLAGIGAFWCLVEMLYESEGIIKRSECERIAFEMRTSCDFINSVICDFELFEFDANDFWSISVNRRIDIRNSKSEKARASASARWSKKNDDANALRTQSECNAIKEKKSKVNKSKVNTDLYPFEDFWNAYQKKVDSKKCKDKWSKLSEEEKKEAMSKVCDYVKSTPDAQFRKNPQTWLNGRCWEDEIIFKHETQTTQKNGQNIISTGKGKDWTKGLERFRERIKDVQ